jgi:hypothetical protein
MRASAPIPSMPIANKAVEGCSVWRNVGRATVNSADLDATGTMVGEVRFIALRTVFKIERRANG